MGFLHAADSAPSSPSLKQRIRSAGRFSCCFRGCGGALDPSSAPSDGGPQSPASSLIHHPSAWLRSKAQELPELRERCRGIVARVGRHRRQSGDFGYDALSYALNFDDGDDEGEISPEGFRHRSFSSRLPPTPTHPAAAAAGVKEIACS